MNRCIIDSGATKTEYLLTIGKEVVFRFKNRGININYERDDEVYNIINECKELLQRENIPEEIVFYGAGCGNSFNRQRIFTTLHHLFPNSSIVVYSDLMGACHALCGKEAGWVAILGTGSSSCMYDGEKIISTAPSLGYLLGDEGSGAHLGKLLLTSYLEDALPDSLRKQLEIQYQLSVPAVMEHLYRKPFPNRFMSSLTPFMLENEDNPFILSLLESSFHTFFTKQLRCFTPNFHLVELNMAGSVAFYFQSVIKNVAKKFGISIMKTLPSPIERLVDYHCSVHY
jgi:N-acetylglucosamine kinase-like BadF-type ATPase